MTGWAQSCVRNSRSRRKAFTLIELLVASAVLIMMLVFLLSAVVQTSNIWRQSTNTINAFQSAREAFDLITRKVSEATLNPYLAYEYTRVGDDQFPTAYRRESDLHFITGANLTGTSQAIFFQAPDGNTSNPQSFGGMSKLLNDCGFYLNFGPDTSWRPLPAQSLKANYRYRLLQLNVPTEELGPYSSSDTAWFSAEVSPSSPNYASRNVPIGENIIAIVFLPKRSPLNEAKIGPLPGGFSYNSRDGATASPQPVTANQLPPLVEVVMLAIDEQSASRLEGKFGDVTPPPITAALAGRLLSAEALETDLQDIAADLTAAGIYHRVFRTTIPVSASKWSESY